MTLDLCSKDRADELVVSVIIPTFGRSDTLARAVSSVYSQNFQAWELIIVDDNQPGSECRRQVHRLVQALLNDQRVRYLTHSSNRGGGAARNTGIAASRGKYVAFLDDDDEWLPHKLGRQVSTFEKLSDYYGLVYSSWNLVDVKTNETRVCKPMSCDVRESLERNVVGPTSVVMCRRSALQNVQGFDVELPSRQDLDLYLRISKSYRFFYIDEPLTNYYLYQTGTISRSHTAVIQGQELFYEKHKTYLTFSSRRYASYLEQSADRLMEAGQISRARSGFISALRAEWNYTRIAKLWICFLPPNLRPIIPRFYRWIKGGPYGQTYTLLGVKGLKARISPLMDALDKVLLHFRSLAKRLGLHRLLRHMGVLKVQQFPGTASYWDEHYQRGGNSGPGSYRHLAEFKARVLNAFVMDKKILSVIEFGCGDGNQFSLSNYPSYTGVDISSTAIELCRSKFSSRKDCKFLLATDYADEQADLAISLDVIFHLVEDRLYEEYMHRLVKSATRYIVIYASDMDQKGPAPQVRHRRFSEFLKRNYPSLRFVSKIANEHPFNGDAAVTSFSDFYIYELPPELH